MKELYVEFEFDSVAPTHLFMPRVNEFFDSLSRDKRVSGIHISVQSCMKEKDVDSLLSYKRADFLVRYAYLNYAIPSRLFVFQLVDPSNDCGIFPSSLIMATRRE